MVLLGAVTVAVHILSIILLSTVAAVSDFLPDNVGSAKKFRRLYSKTAPWSRFELLSYPRYILEQKTGSRLFAASSSVKSRMRSECSGSRLYFETKCETVWMNPKQWKLCKGRKTILRRN